MIQKKNLKIELVWQKINFEIDGGWRVLIFFFRLTHLLWSHEFLAFKGEHRSFLVKATEPLSIGIECVVVVVSKSLQIRE
jgi:hypothetical protein